MIIQDDFTTTAFQQALNPATWAVMPGYAGNSLSGYNSEASATPSPSAIRAATIFGVNQLGGNIWTANTFGEAQFAQARFGKISAVRQGVSIRSATSGVDLTCYSGGVLMSGGDSRATIWLFNNNNLTVLGTNPSMLIAVGDTVYLEGSGPNLTLYVNGNVAVQLSDATLTSGAIGLELVETPGTVGNHFEFFEGGDIGLAPPPPPTLTGVTPHSLPIGGQAVTVTLTGTGFLAEPTVVNGADATVVISNVGVVGDTLITCTVQFLPATARGPHVIWVTTQNGSSSTQALVAQTSFLLDSFDLGTVGQPLSSSGNWVARPGFNSELYFYAAAGYQGAGVNTALFGAANGNGHIVVPSNTRGQFARVIFRNLANYYQGVCVLIAPTTVLNGYGAGTAFNRYNDYRVALWRWVNGALTVLATGTAIIQAGDLVQLNIRGFTLTVLQNNNIILTFNDTPNPLTSGRVGLEMTDQSSTQRVYFDQFLAGPIPPNLASLSPNNGNQGDTVAVTLSGTDFSGTGVDPFAVQISGTGFTLNVISVNPNDTALCNFVIASNAVPGVHWVTVSTALGTSQPLPFTIGAVALPTLTGMSPNSAPLANQPTTMTLPGIALSGTNFSTPGFTVNVVGSTASGFLATNVSVLSDRQASFDLVVPANTAPGSVTVSVTTNSGSSNTLPFAIEAVVTPPPPSGGGGAIPITMRGGFVN